MHRCLVVANQTVGAPHLADALLDRAGRAPARFHLVVPVAHASDQPWSDPAARAQAEAQLARGLAWFGELGLDGSGEVAEHDVVAAVRAVLDGQDFDEVVLSTQPPGVSRWLRWDVPRRLAQACPDVVLTHVEDRAQPAAV